MRPGRVCSVPPNAHTVHSEQRSAAIIRPGGVLVSIVRPVEVRPADGRAVDFVVESVPAQLRDIAAREDRRIRTNIGQVVRLPEAVTALNSTDRRKGKLVVTLTD
jgi:hypothetical protein